MNVTITESQVAARAPAEVLKMLEDCRIARTRVRLFYGDPQTGRDHLEEHDTMGRIGQLEGDLTTLRLLSDDEDGGVPILADSVVRILDLRSKQDLYRHPQYHLPEMEVRSLEGVLSNSSQEQPVPLTSLGFTHGVWVQEQDGTMQRHASFGSESKADHWMAFLSGDRHTLRA